MDAPKGLTLTILLLQLCREAAADVDIAQSHKI